LYVTTLKYMSDKEIVFVVRLCVVNENKQI